MEAFTYSRARQNLSLLLDIALKQGEVKIRRRDGTNFVIKPEKAKKTKSPFDIKGVDAKNLGKEDLFRAIRDGRKEY